MYAYTPSEVLSGSLSRKAMW